MKNIHVLPTDKETRLYLSNYGKELNLASHPKTLYSTGQNIYITSDEEIKEGDWYCSPNGITSKHNGTEMLPDNWNKVILTTDLDLIKDGVQAIDDEFLEWFAKNPSCEEVGVKTFEVEDYVGFAGHTSYPTFHNEYKIIIPSEEPKKETPEEAAERLFPVFNRSTPFGSKYPWTPQKEREAFKRGYRLAQERSYSEEEVYNIVNKTVDKFCTFFSDDLKQKVAKEWFEQFKKK